MPGQVVERELKKGGRHGYQITLAPGQYVHILVEQFGIDVEVILAGPAGQEVAKLDWWWAEGTESLWGLAAAGGEYTLTVRDSGERSEDGKYRVKFEKVVGWAEAPDPDRGYVQAHRHYAEGEALFATGTEESRRKALEKYRESLPFWRDLGDGDAEAHTLHQMGTLEYQLGNLKQAAEYLDRAVGLFRASRNRFGVVNSLNTLGIVYNYTGDAQKALVIYHEALPLARAIKDHGNEARILSGLGVALPKLGQTQQALGVLDELLSLAKATGNPAGESMAHNAIAVIYIRQGKLREAIQHFEQTLSSLRARGDVFNQATVLGNIGHVYVRMGELQTALDFLLQGLEKARSSGDRRVQALSLVSIGHVYRRMGDYPKARQYYEQTLHLSRETGIPVTEASALNGLAQVYDRTGDPKKALEYAERALALLTPLGDRYSEAVVLTGLGMAHSRLDEPRKALDYYARALSVQREVGDEYGEPVTLSALAAVHARLGDGREARALLDQALTLTRKTGDRLGESSVLYQSARLERSRGDSGAARSQVEAALDIVESIRTKVTLTDTRTAYFSAQQDLYDFYIDLLMQSYAAGGDENDLAAALRANERRRARSLLDSLAEARADIRADMPPELLERERRLLQDLNAKADQQVRLLSQRHTDAQVASITREIDALSAEHEQVSTRLRQSSRRYAALTRPATLTLEQIRKQVLDADTVLLEYTLGEERSYLWAVTPTSLRGYELPKRQEVEALARQVYDLLTARNRFVKFEEPGETVRRVSKADAEYPRAAASLSRMLLGPVASQLRGKRLLIVGDGILQYLPFAALPLPRPPGGPARAGAYVPLLAAHEVVGLPSASALAVLRQELAERKPAPKTVAVFADPVFDRDDVRVEKTRPVSGAKSQPAAGPETRHGVTPTGGAPAGPAGLLAQGEKEALYALPRVPFTRGEAEAIAALVPAEGREQHLDFAASRAAATDPRLGQYRYIHFATHVILDPYRPELSGIALSQITRGAEQQDGFLRAYEVYNLSLAADLVVLSGCKTGLGREVRGEGVLSLTQGFMHAGAARVVASLWDIEDESTAALMAHLYRGMLGKGRLSPAAALRRAQLEMWRSGRWGAPYFWAAFVLHGEHR